MLSSMVYLRLQRSIYIRSVWIHYNAREASCTYTCYLPCKLHIEQKIRTKQCIISSDEEVVYWTGDVPIYNDFYEYNSWKNRHSIGCYHSHTRLPEMSLMNISCDIAQNAQYTDVKCFPNHFQHCFSIDKRKLDFRVGTIDAFATS